MKNYYLVIISILITVLSFGQNTKADTIPDNKKTSKIRLTPFFSYDINLSSEIEFDGLDIYIFNYDNFNYKIGVDIEFKLNNRISISSGLNYSQKDFSFLSNCYNCGSLEEEIQMELRFLEIPLIGIYTYEINDFEIFGQIGIVNHINIGLNIFINDEGISRHNIDSHSLSGKIGLGASYPVFNRHHIFIASDYSIGLTNVFENIDYKLKTLGIRMGIQFLL